jgi:hypothetical protein
MPVSTSALVTNAEAQEYLGSSADFTNLCNLASAACEVVTRGPLVQREATEFYTGTAHDGRTGGSAKFLYLRRYPVVSVAEIKDGAGNLVAAADYYIRKRAGILEHSYSFPTPYESDGRVGEWAIKYTAGWFANTAAVPFEVKLAALMTLAVRNTSATPGAEELDLGDLRVKFASLDGDAGLVARSLPVPPEAHALLGRYIINRV